MRLAFPLLLAFVLAAPTLAQRGVGPAAPGSRGNDRLIREALVGLGVRPGGATIESAVDAAFEALLPGEDYRRYRLNAVQARAIAWTAVLLAAEGAAGPLPDPDPPAPVCYDVVQLVYDLAAAVPPRAYGLFLTDEEKQAARPLSTEIRRAASACGCYALADAALELDGMLASGLNVGREDVVEHIAGMRALAAACP